jgi:O-antigen/teichoic acid export membrane protein
MRLADLVARLRGDGAIRQLAGPSLISVVVTILSAGLTYLMFVALARVMTVAEYGRFSFTFNLATFLCFVAGFGLHNAILRWLPEYQARNQPDAQRAVFAWSLGMTLLGSLLTWTAAVAGLVALDAVGLAPPDASKAALLLLAPLAFAELISASLRTRDALIWSLAPKDVAWRVIVLGWCAALLATGRAVSAGAAILVMGVALSGLVAVQLVAYFRRSGGLSAHRGGAAASDAAGWRRTATPIWLAGILISLIQYMDVVLVGLMRGPVETAHYFVAARTASLMGLLLVGSNMVCAPIISRLIHSDRYDELRRVLMLNAIGIAVPTLAVLLVFVVFGRFVLAIFGAEFAGDYDLLVVLSIGYALNALGGPMSYVLQIAGQERAYLRIMTITYAGTFVFQLVTIAAFGAIGAAIGSAAGLLVLNLWSRRVAIGRVGVDPTILSTRRPLGAWLRSRTRDARG